MSVPLITMDILIVFSLIFVTIILFATEYFSPDIIAISVIVAVVVLEPWTGIGSDTAFIGFANTATITVAAMYMLSEGIHKTGIVDKLTKIVSDFAHGSDSRLLGIMLGLTGVLAGFVNNTPVVAVFIPMVTDLAEKHHISPSKLLIPLSYASMLGGTMTLIGTSTNLLASTFSARLIDHPFSMFEFTHLGFIGLVVGIIYLMTVGQKIIPSRIEPYIDLLGEFNLRSNITRLYIRDSSSLVGKTLESAIDDLSFGSDIDVIEVFRGDEHYAVPGPDFELQSRDILTVRADHGIILQLASELNLWPLPWVRIDDFDVNVPETIGTLVKIRIPSGSDLIGKKIKDVSFRQKYSATILAIDHKGKTIVDNFEETILDTDDTILLRTASGNIDVLRDTDNILVSAIRKKEFINKKSETQTEYKKGKSWIAIAIIVSVVLIATLGWMSIGIAALAGVVAMIVSGILEAKEAYDAVSWDVIFLLAGMIPLGIALENSGGSEFIAELIVLLGGSLPLLVVLGLFYILSAIMTNFISHNATVVLLIPVAVNVAFQLNANAFSFILAVTFAASASFLTPISYQTNLMVYGPGGYKFTDFIRVGTPLQLLLAVVTTLGIWIFWGV